MRSSWCPESVEQDRRGFWGSVLTAVNQAAFITGAFILTIVSHYLTAGEQFFSWGWRGTFLLSIVMIAVGVYIRLRVQESPEFVELEKRHETATAPVTQVFRNPRNVLAVLAIRIGENTFYYAISVFAISYAVGMLQVSRSVVLDAITLGAALAIVGSLIGGAPWRIVTEVGRSCLQATSSSSSGSYRSSTATRRANRLSSRLRPFLGSSW